MNAATRLFAIATFLMLLPAAASAQEGQIAGIVRDSSGAVMPGVLVEVTSPALIEKVRSATTDGSGQYRITEPARRHLHGDVHAGRVLETAA